MEQCLHRYFIDQDEIKSTCDFIPSKYIELLPVYEVIRIIDGKPLFLSEHLQRLEQSMTLLNFPLLISRARLHSAIQAIISTNAVDFGNIRIHIGIGDKNNIPRYACWWIPHSYPDISDYKNGVDTVLSKTSRKEPNAKVYREAYKKQQQDLIDRKKVYETILYDENGITEGSKSNLFFITDKKIITAADAEVLKGITRKKVIDICNEFQIPLEYRKLSIPELAELKAAFISGTSPKILPIRSIDAVHQLNPQHEWVQKIRSAYEKLISMDLDRFRWVM